VADVFRICFVCLGNICRSPMAEVVMRQQLHDAGLEGRIEVRSAGTGDWHVGERADPRTVEALGRHGYDGSQHRARQFVRDMFDESDLVVAMDGNNLVALSRVAPPGRADDVVLLRSFDPDADGTDVPDPYYGGPDGFDEALAMVESSCRGLLGWLQDEILATS
jgi:protein-tyrosine phosphatase